MLTIAYCRVSTAEQSTENQVHEIASAGYEADLVFADEGVSGSTQAAARPEFRSLMGTIEKASEQVRLVVTKLDRLGRDTLDILKTVDLLKEQGVQIIVLQLGTLDLTSAAGKLTLNVLSAVAEMERDLIRERTKSGLARAKASGVRLGRRPKLNEAQRAQVRQRLSAKESVSAVARDMEVSRATIISIRDRASG